MITKLLLPAILVVFVLCDAVLAQDFEGVYRQRTITVDPDATYELLGESAYDAPPAVADALADLSMDAALSMGEVEMLVVYQKGPWTRAQPDVEGEP